jgi:hypothetical protein
MQSDHIKYQTEETEVGHGPLRIPELLPQRHNDTKREEESMVRIRQECRGFAQEQRSASLDYRLQITD